MDVFICDMGSTIVDRLGTALCKAGWIEVKMTTIYHHLLNGQAERMI
jgi:hypothetical protein